MRCPTQDGNAEVLLDYSSGKLSSEATATFERHMEQCSECARFASAQGQLWDALDSWDAMSVSEDFDERLYARIEASGGRQWWQGLVSLDFGWKPAIAAATATLALGAFLLAPRGAQTAKQSPARPEMALHSDTIEPEQVERALEDLDMLRQLNANSGAQTPSAL